MDLESEVERAVEDEDALVELKQRLVGDPAHEAMYERVCFYLGETRQRAENARMLGDHG